MRRNPERTAWAVLLGSFCIFCALLLLIPLSLRWWLQNATNSQQITMESSGTVLVVQPGRTNPEANLTDILVGSTISVPETDSQATLILTDRGSRAELALVKLYSGTVVKIVRADSPRYRAGLSSHHLQLQLSQGRVRVTSVAADTRHATKIDLLSPLDVITTLGGVGNEVALEILGTQTTSLAVLNGYALIAYPDGQSSVLLKDQRAEASESGLRAPLPPERKLINDGYFEQPLGITWAVDKPQRTKPDDALGSVQLENSAGRQIVHFYREGHDWGHVGISQSINQDVRDFKTLRLQLDVRVSNQDLYNCGDVGSECPVMVKIAYVDIYGRQRYWLKGFFYNFSPNIGQVTSIGKVTCPRCEAVASDHERVIRDEWEFIETENLMELFYALDYPPALIQSIYIYADGHSFDSAITQIQLLGSE